MWVFKPEYRIGLYPKLKHKIFIQLKKGQGDVTVGVVTDHCNCEVLGLFYNITVLEVDLDLACVSTDKIVGDGGFELHSLLGFVIGNVVLQGFVVWGGFHNDVNLDASAVYVVHRFSKAEILQEARVIHQAVCEVWESIQC